MRIRIALLAAAFAVSASAAELNLTPLKTSDIYAVGEPAGWTVSVPAGVTTPPATTYTYTIKTNQMETIGSGTFDLMK